MLIAVDVDGTIDAIPDQLATLMQALRSAGHTVHILTGIEDDSVGPDDLQEKADYLGSLGCGQNWDRLVLVPEPHPENKAAYCDENGVDLLIDNNKKNAKAVGPICPVLVPWQSRE